MDDNDNIAADWDDDEIADDADEGDNVLLHGLNRNKPRSVLVMDDGIAIEADDDVSHGLSCNKPRSDGIANGADDGNNADDVLQGSDRTIPRSIASNCVDADADDDNVVHTSIRNSHLE